MNALLPLIAEARALYEAAVENPVVLKPAIPILYFGDSDAYYASPVRVITVGLNPSRIEFPEQDRFLRFPAARNVNWTSGNGEVEEAIEQALDEYFCVKPYRRWFDPSFEWLLNGMDASYYGTATNTALHTDIGSPLATDPTWSGLNDQQRHQLQKHGVMLWHQLVEVLQPDVMIASVARWYLSKVYFAATSPWTAIWSRPTKDDGTVGRPYHVEAQWLRLSSGKETLLVFGRAAHQPFGLLSKEHKRQIGRAINEALNGR